MKNIHYVLGLLLFPFFLSAQLTYIHCGKMIDVVNGKVLSEMTIIVEKKLIKEVQKGYTKAPNNATVIDLKNNTVMPGWIDMHVHIEGETSRDNYLLRYTLNEAEVAYRAIYYAETSLMAGFTTLRDLGGTGVNVAMRDAIARGLFKGPRLLTAAKSISVTGGHADPTNGAKRGLYDYPVPQQGVADGVDECRKAVRQQYKNGADWIKITATGGVLSVAKDGRLPHFSEEEITAIVQTAKDMGLKVAAHAHGDEGIRRAAKCGVATIEHGTFMSDETMELMKKMGTYFVPTITAGKAVGDSSKIQGYYPSIVAVKAAEIGPKIQATFAKAYKKGVKIAFGTDAGVYAHGKNAMEFIYMNEAGMPMMEAIQSATIVNAEVLDLKEKLGSIEAGKWADIIALKDDPTQNSRAVLDVKFVMKEGTIFKKP